MPIRFSTEAANADVLGEDPESTGATEAAARADGAPKDPFERPARSGTAAGDAKPGKDINAAGFVKDKDSSQP
jgi:hypothetical protein